MVITHFEPQKTTERISFISPRVVMDPTMWGSRPSHFIITPNTKRHPTNAKRDQLPVSEVITGLPMPYHNIYT